MSNYIWGGTSSYVGWPCPLSPPVVTVTYPHFFLFFFSFYSIYTVSICHFLLYLYFLQLFIKGSSFTVSLFSSSSSSLVSSFLSLNI